MTARRPVVLAGGRFRQLPADDTLDVPAAWDALKTPSIAAGALALDLSSPAGFRVALNQNVTALTFAGVPSGRVVVFTVTWVQDATGGRTVAFPASVKADGGGAPVQPAAGASAVTVQSFYTDDGGVTVWQAGAGATALQSVVIAGTIGSAFTGNPGLSAAAKIPFNEFWSNVGGITYEAATRRFYVPSAGTYRAQISGLNTQSSTGNRVLVGVNNDAPTNANHRGVGYTPGQNQLISLSATFDVPAGGYIVFYLAQGSLNNEVSNKLGQFSIEKVAA